VNDCDRSAPALSFCYEFTHHPCFKVRPGGQIMNRSFIIFYLDLRMLVRLCVLHNYPDHFGNILFNGVHKALPCALPAAVGLHEFVNISNDSAFMCVA
jgi:hypothetical protein